MHHAEARIVSGRQNPFTGNRDREEIWDILMRRDFVAFVAADWGLVADDFEAEEFWAIDAAATRTIASWRVGFPRLGVYQELWLQQAARFRADELVGVDKLAFLYGA